MIGSFSLVRFPSRDDPDIVYIEGVTGDIFAESEDARSYPEVFDHLRAAALSPRSRVQELSAPWTDWTTNKEYVLVFS